MGASYKNRRLRNPETLCRYIIARVNESIYFFITLRNISKKFFSRIYYILSFGSRGAGSRRLRNPNLNKSDNYLYLYIKNINIKAF